MGVWDFKSGRRQSTWRRKSKCLVDKCLWGLQRPWDTEQPLSSGPACSRTLSGEAVSGQARHLQAPVRSPRPACLLPEFLPESWALIVFSLK